MQGPNRQLALVLAGAAIPGALVGRWTAPAIEEQVCCRSEANDFEEGLKRGARQLDGIVRTVKEVAKAAREPRADCPGRPDEEEIFRRELLAGFAGTVAVHVLIALVGLVRDGCDCCRRAANEGAAGLRVGHRRRGGGVLQ